MSRKDKDKTGNLDLFNELSQGSVKDTEVVISATRDVVEQTVMEKQLQAAWLSISNDAIFEEITSWQIC
jgi:hypothetical protein